MIQGIGVRDKGRRNTQGGKVMARMPCSIGYHHGQLTLGRQPYKMLLRTVCPGKRGRDLYSSQIKDGLITLSLLHFEIVHI